MKISTAKATLFFNRFLAFVMAAAVEIREENDLTV